MYYYPGHRIHTQFCTQSALSPLPGEHSGQSPFYRRAQCQLNHNSVRILPGPHLTPGSRAAMWIKCLAEGQKYQATVGFEPILSAWGSSSHTTIPRHLQLQYIHSFIWDKEGLLCLVTSHPLQIDNLTEWLREKWQPGISSLKHSIVLISLPHYTHFSLTVNAKCNIYILLFGIELLWLSGRSCCGSVDATTDSQ